MGAERGWALGTDFTQIAKCLFTPEGERIEGAEEALGDDLRNDGEDAAQAPADEDLDALAAAAAAAEDGIHPDLVRKMPGVNTVAIVTDIPRAIEAAAIYGIPAFDLNDTIALADFVESHFVRPRVTVVIQAGGESRRMGRSKATVPFLGRPLICRLIERLSPVADDLVITTNEPDNLTFLHQEFPQLNIQLVCDIFSSRGALPGLYTALQAARNPYVAIVACDMVFASGALVVAEALCMNETGADVVVPVNKHGFEPFHAMYRRMECLPAVRRALDRGEKRAQSFFGDESVVVHEFPQSKVLEAEPMGGCFINANTPDELHALEDMVMEG